MQNIGKALETYYLKNTQKKELEDELKPINAEIKGFISDHGLEALAENGYVAKVTVQDRSKMNQEKLLWKLRELGHVTAIKTVEVPDEQEVERLIFTGALTPDVLKACMEEHLVEVLTVKKEKAKAPAKGRKTNAK